MSSLIKYLSIYQPIKHKYKILGSEIRSIFDQIHPGDIILKGYNGIHNLFQRDIYPLGGIYVSDGYVACVNNSGVELVDIIDFCMCDRLVIIRLVSNDTLNQFTLRAIRRCDQFVDISNDYDCMFDGINKDPYSLDLIDLCYKELKISRTNNKIASKDILNHPSFNLVYGNEVVLL